MQRNIIKELLTHSYLYYQVSYIQDNKEVTELWVCNSIDAFIKIKAYALRGLSKDPTYVLLIFFLTRAHLRNSSLPSCFRRGNVLICTTS